jgi:hypothetical protein
MECCEEAIILVIFWATKKLGGNFSVILGLRNLPVYDGLFEAYLTFVSLIALSISALSV